ncbi:hypothetical protein OPQ81_010618 [Rhizoctonia solani]|nr:hypothetical protein OPQ81_010618 [Rhizoctonia solani]
MPGGQCLVPPPKQVPPLVQGVDFQARYFGYIIAGLFTFISVIVSAWLVQKHLRWYSCKPQQQYIVRLLFMVPIYAIITLASYVFPVHAISLRLIRDVYESVVLASFFSLLLEYLPGPRHPGPSVHIDKGEPLDSENVDDTNSIGFETMDRPLTKAERATVVYKVFYRVPMYRDSRTPHTPLKWIFPLCLVRARPKDGLSYLHWMRWGVLQYCIVRPGTTLAAVVLQQLNLYCESSWNWRWGQVYVVTIVSVSVTVAMYCLIQLYTTISQELRSYRPLLKLFAVIAVIFLTFWQSTLLSGLGSLGIIKDTEYLTAQDITVGFSALLQTFEMMCFAFLHVKAFSYVPYKRIARIRAHALEQVGRNQVPVSERDIDPDMPPLLSSPHPQPKPRDYLPAPFNQQLFNLVQAFAFADAFRDLRAGVLYFFGRGPSREADDVCRREERFREMFGRDRETSFVRVGGYKGVPQDEYKFTRLPMSELRYSPLPTPPQEDYDDAPPLSLLHTRESDNPVRGGDYVAPRLDYVPAPPPRGAYVPAHGPGPSLTWSGGMVTPPRTPVFVSPGDRSSSYVLGVESPSTIPGVISPQATSPRMQAVSPVRGSSRRIGDVYVGGTRGGEFAPRPTVDVRPGRPLRPYPPDLFLRPVPKACPNLKKLSAPQKSFASDAQNYPVSPVSPTMLRVAHESAPPRTSGETQRTSGYDMPSQRNSGFTLPPWASGTPTHSQWPSGVTSSRRTSANTMPPSPTRGGRMSISEDVEPPSSSRDDSLLVRVFSGATRTTESRTRDSESAGARASMVSVQTGDCISSSNGSDAGTNEGASVQPVRTVSFRSGAPVLVRLGERRDSISSPSLVSSSYGDRREASDPSTPTSTSSRPSPPSDSP